MIPADCFEPDTAKSLGYLSVSLIGTALCTVLGVSALSFLNPANPLTWPFWAAYSAVTGTVAMGLWVLSHEVRRVLLTAGLLENFRALPHKKVSFLWPNTTVRTWCILKEQTSPRLGWILFPLPDVGTILFMATITRRSSPIHQQHRIG